MIFSFVRGSVRLFIEVALHFQTGDLQFKCAHCYDILKFPLNKIVIDLESTKYITFKVFVPFRSTNALKTQPFVHEKFKMAKNLSTPLPSETIKVHTDKNSKK